MFVLRVFTMLAFVVVLPAVAIMGLSLPASVRELIEPSAVERRDTGSAVARIEPTRKSPAGEKPARENPGRETPPRQPDAYEMEEPATSTLPHSPDVAPAPWRSPNPPSELPVDSGTQPLRTEPSTGPANYPSTGVDPLVRPASAEGTVRSIDMPTDTPRRADAAPSEFLEIQQRLQDLGSTYYRLETWSGRSQFRFHCRMAVRENSHYSRNFEATDADPMAAMRKVLEQVERWRAGPAPRP